MPFPPVLRPSTPPFPPGRQGPPPLPPVPTLQQPTGQPHQIGQLPRLPAPISLVLYGPTGSGKTTLASWFGRTGFVLDSQEQGIRYLVANGLVPPPVFIEQFPAHHSSWKKGLDFINNCARRNDIDTLVVESLTGWQTICFKDHGKRRFSTTEFPEGDFTNGNNGFYSYAKGPKNAAQFDFPDFMEALQNVLESKKNVIVTGHSSDKQDTTVTGETFLKVVPAVEKEIWVKVARWASIVAYMAPKVETDRDKSRGSLRKIAKQDMARYMYCQATPFFEAKNWWGMRNPVIDCGNSGQECFSNFIRALGY